MESYFLNIAFLWIPLTIIGVLNGAFRGLVLTRFLSDIHSHQFSSLLMIIFVFLYTSYVFVWLRIRKPIDAWKTGLIWLSLTVTFELALGYFMLRSSMSSMLSQYNLLAGNLWPLVLLGITTIPWLIYRFGERQMSELN